MEIDAIFEHLIGIPSPSRREARVAEWVEGFCHALGYAVARDDARAAVAGDCSNLLVRAPGGSGPTLLLCAHLDTVEAGDRPVVWTREGDIYSATGETILGADDKCGVACLLALLQRMREEAVTPAGEVRVVFTVCEEIELLGALALPDAWLDGVDAAYALDHSDPCDLVRGAPAKDAFRVTVRGIAGHASAPERRINAVHLLAGAMARLPSGRLDPESTANLGILRGGTKINVIPDAAYAEYELRSHDEARLDHHAAHTRAVLEHAAAEAAILTPETNERREAGIEIDHERCYHAYRLDDDALPLRLARAAVDRSGWTPRLGLGPGGSDATVPNRRRVPARVLGSGLPAAHRARARAHLAAPRRGVATLGHLVAGAGAS